MEIVLVRHGQTDANAARIMQGQSGAQLSELGESQVSALQQRLEESHFDLIVASDLPRTLETAERLGRDFEVDPRWREMDIGQMEGISWEDARDTFRDHWKKVRAGENVRFGGGETIGELGSRVAEGVDALRARMGPDQRALVVSHGGAINEAVKYIVGHPWTLRRFGLTTNTSMTVVREWRSKLQLRRFNDATHLAPIGAYEKARVEQGFRSVALVRHGQTDANLERRWQGWTDSGLNDQGRLQAQALNAWLPSEVVRTSPSGRAFQTAEALGEGLPELRPELAEMRMGGWEGMTTDEIRAESPDIWEKIYTEGIDLARGGDGESWGDVASRMSEVVKEEASASDGARPVLVSHGAAIRSFVTSVLGVSHADRDRLVTVDNTAVTSVVYEDNGPIIADFNLAPHLEAM